jgi:peptidylprolyl isomerase
VITKLVVPMTAAFLAFGLAACGQQTDDRVATDTEAMVEESTSVQSEIAAATPYVTLDCVSLQAMPTDAPPAQATTIGAASAIFQPNGAPAITIATDNTPATELGIADIREGEGAEVQPGDTVTVDYCGVGYGGQAVFDSSWARGEPANFPLPNLIPGWQEGIPGMKVGGQRLLIVPGELAYGETGTQGIQPNETLAFVIQLDAIG